MQLLAELVVGQSHSLLVLGQLVTSGTIHSTYSHGIGALATRAVVGWTGCGICRGIGLERVLALGALEYLLCLGQKMRKLESWYAYT